MSTTEKLNGSTTFTAAKTLLLTHNDERTEGELNERTTTNDAMRQAILFWMKILVILYDSSSLIIVFLTLAVQYQSPLFLNPTNVAAPWSNEVYAPWFIVNVVSLGCGIVGVVSGKLSLVAIALVLTAADFVLFMIIGRGKLIILLYAMNAAIVHMLFLYYSKRNPPALTPNSTQVETGRRCNFHVQRIVVFALASMNLILQSSWSWQAVHDSTGNYQGLPLASSVIVLWWIVSALSLVLSMIGVMFRNYGLVVVGMIGCLVNIVVYLFRGNTLDGQLDCTQSSNLLTFYLVFIIALLNYEAVATDSDKQHNSTTPVQAEV